jgi:hypothetical protein
MGEALDAPADAIFGPMARHDTSVCPPCVPYSMKAGVCVSEEEPKMADTITKADLLRQIAEGYEAFQAQIAPLSTEQMTTPSVNGPWSVKDNLAHLTAWHDYLTGVLRGVASGVEPAPVVPGGETEDEENERLYQAHKDDALDDVRRDFGTSYQDVVAAVEALDEAALNRPAPWSTSERPVWGIVAGNTYGHYAEHGDIIRHWLAGD